jgi:hypothetical protein
MTLTASGATVARQRPPQPARLPPRRDIAWGRPSVARARISTPIPPDVSRIPSHPKKVQAAAWPAPIQRCGIGSSCDCPPHEKLAGVRRDLETGADRAAAALHARALTSGTDIMFRSGAYQPGTPGGDRLLAHELSHVLQQRSGPVSGTDIGGGIPVFPSSQPGVIQRHLVVGQADDPLEAEADRVADRVMSSGVQPIYAGPAARIGRKCTDCGDDEKKLQAKRLGAPRAGSGQAPEIVHAVLGSAGQPLDSEALHFFGRRFGRDFSTVRVHADGRAAESAASIGAQAYTVGSDIVFGAGRLDLASRPGWKLLAHELTHVVQQAGAGRHPVPIRRQDVDTGGEEDHVGPGNSAESNAPGSVTITEDLFEPQEEPAATQLQASADSSAELSVRRQASDPRIADIPPPSPFPGTDDWLSGEVVDQAGSLYGMSCQDRRERGFYVMWNQRTNKSFPGETAIGDPVKGCHPAEIHLGPMPPDRKPIFAVGWFHTHPPANPGCRKTGVGPSDVDKNTSRSSGLPGMVADTVTATSPCGDFGYFFFGPEIRQ